MQRRTTNDKPNRIRVRGVRLEKLDTGKLAMASWLCAKRLIAARQADEAQAAPDTDAAADRVSPAEPDATRREAA